MSFVRPSLANRVEECGLVAKLAEEYPETNDNIERGNEVDLQFTAGLVKDVVPLDADARACVEWVRTNLAGYTLHVKEKVELTDPETGKMLTRGEPDIQGVDKELDAVETVDVKKREQYFAGHLPGPDDNLQLHIYSLARALKSGAQRYRNTILLFGDGEVEPVQGKWHPADEWWPFLERVRAVQTKERNANPGARCGRCYSREVCPSYRERARLAMTVIEEDVKTLALTDETARELLMRAEAVIDAAELAKKLVRAYAEAGGKIEAGGKVYKPIMMPGKKSADVKSLLAAGLNDHIKTGAPFPQWRWVNAKK